MGSVAIFCAYDPKDIKELRKCPFYQHFRGSVRYSNSAPPRKNLTELIKVFAYNIPCFYFYYIISTGFLMNCCQNVAIEIIIENHSKINFHVNYPKLPVIRLYVNDTTPVSQQSFESSIFSYHLCTTLHCLT